MNKYIIIIALISISLSSFCQKGKRKFTRQFYFEYASYELDSSEQLKVKKFKRILNKFDFITIEVTGHTDSDGSDLYNQKLSQKRIESVINALTDSVLDSLFITIPKGEKEPIVKNTDSTKHQNRRVTVVAYYSGKKGGKKESIPLKKHPKPKHSGQLSIKKEELISGKIIDLPSVRFHGGTAEFLPGASEILEKVVQLLSQNPKVKVEIAGHICCGNDMGLSIARAKRVYSFLVNNGIDKSRLSYKGYNNTQPKYGNIMDIRNRRVELKVL